MRLGVADAHSGVSTASLSLTADFAVEGRAPGAELAHLLVATGQGIHTLNLTSPLPRMDEANLHASVRDMQGNITRTTVTFSTTLGPNDLFNDGFE
ncbi:MAG: hypothetical protein LKM39_15320 [Chiayiivirga sp.]|nr:hypothetical protein [Chiayiivirga sp.]